MARAIPNNTKAVRKEAKLKYELKLELKLHHPTHISLYVLEAGRHTAVSSLRSTDYGLRRSGIRNVDGWTDPIA